MSATFLVFVSLSVQLNNAAGMSLVKFHKS